MSFPIPEKALRQNIIALGKTGSGKSSALRDIVEPMLDQKLPVCIIDPKGDWWGLKLSADGKKPGYPLVIFGGKHADVPINERSGTHIAELFATGNRPCVIDLRGWMPGARTQFFIDFAATLFEKNEGRRWLVIDECHNFCPKGKVLDPKSGLSLHWANRLASEGRGLGITVFGASQRPQKVHNDFLTSCETLIAMRVLHASDRGAYKDWIDGCGDPAKGKEMLATIANLKRGNGYVWSPEIGFGPELVRFPLFKTYDSFAPQDEGKAAKLTGWAEVDLEEVKKKLADVVQEAEANDPKLLKQRIAELERDLAAPAKSNPEVDRMRQDQHRLELEEVRIKAIGLGVEIASAEIRAKLSSVIQAGDDLVERLKSIAEINIEIPEYKIPQSPNVQPVNSKPTARVTNPTRAGASNGSGKSSGLPKPERSILTVLAQYPQGRTRQQVSLISGYSIRSSSFANALSSLRSSEYITRTEPMRITERGLAALGEYERLPVGKDLLEHWKNNLGKAERALLEVIADRRSRAVSKDELSRLSGYSETSSSFANALSKLRSLELISRGEIRINEDLFG